MSPILGILVLLAVAALLGLIVAAILSLGKRNGVYRAPQPPMPVHRFPISDGPFDEDVNPEEDEQMRSGDEE